MITQQCTVCGETKELNAENFHRNRNYVTGHLRRCKICQRKDVTRYNQANPQYWKKYRVDNAQYIRDYYEEYYDTDQPIKIYGIQNPLGEVYVGMSQMRDWKIRIAQHRSSYRTKHGSYPKLHESVDTHSWDNHTFILIEEMDTKDRSRGMCRESLWIEHYVKMNKSLNVHKTK
jgi:predicted GIY-YIG superfamily endonuclease